MNQLQFTISDSAKDRLGTLLKSKGAGILVRIGLRSGGCKGAEQYTDFSPSETPEDTRLDCGDFTVLIDPKSMVMLAGATFDWKTSLTENRFVLTFPNSKPTCGCGNSFTI